MTAMLPGKSSRMWQWLQYGVAAVLIGVILLTVNFHDFVTALRSISLWYVLLAIIVFAINRLIMGYKWSVLLRARGYAVFTWMSTKIYIMGGTLAIILPSTIGLDAARIHLVCQRGVKLADALVSVFVERLLGIMALAAMCLVGVAILLVKAVDFPAGWLAFLTAVALAVAGAALVLAPRAGPAVATFLPVAAEQKVRALLSQAGTAFATYRGRPGIIAYVLVWSLIEQIPHVVATYLLALGLHMGVGIIDCLAVVPLVMIVDRLPLSIDGLGVREGAMVFFFGLLGVPPAKALLLSLATRAVGYVFVGLGWGMYVLQKPSHSPRTG